MDIFKSFDISASGMLAQKRRMNTIASNLANINTTRTPEGGPYKRRDVVFESVLIDEENSLEGVRVRDVVEDDSPPRVVYDPG
ncbi:MAG: flagellar basal body rod protein FlgC, partial [Nitrospirae bacterium]